MKLTDRESAVLEGISIWLTTKEIAKRLYLSDHTIVTYRKILFRKLQALNAPELVRKGFEHGVLQFNAA
jgi:DNA-binding NarL/FixJ family response regulator